MFQLLVCGTRYGTQGLLFHDPTSSILACRTIRAPLRSRSCPCNWRCRLSQILMLLEQISCIKEIQYFAPNAFTKSDSKVIVWICPFSNVLHSSSERKSASKEKLIRLWNAFWSFTGSAQTRCGSGIVAKFFWESFSAKQGWMKLPSILSNWVVIFDLNRICGGRWELLYIYILYMRWPCQGVLLILKTFLLSVWGTHNYEHMFQICKVSFPNFLELVSSCLTLRLLSKSSCSCREHPVVLL